MTSSESNRSSTIRGSQSSKGSRTIGQRTKRQKRQPACDRSMPTLVGMQPLPRSTLTMPPTLRRGIQLHHVVNGAPYQSLSNAKVRARRPSTLRDQREMPASLQQNIWTRPTPMRSTSMQRTSTLLLVPLPVLLNHRMLVQTESAHVNTQVGRRCSRAPATQGKV